MLVAARGPAGPIGERIEALARWYGTTAAVETVAGEAVTIASLGGPLHGASFGEPPPATIDLMRAGPEQLQRYMGGGVALARTDDRAALVGGAGNPAMLFEATSTEVEAFSTHAVAAGYVAYGTAVFEPATLPELAAYGCTGGDRTTIAGVRALPPGTLADLDASRVTVTDWWPPGAEPPPLPETLRQRLAGIGPVHASTRAIQAARALAEIRVDSEPWEPRRARGDVRWTDGYLAVLDLPDDGAAIIDCDEIQPGAPLSLEGAEPDAVAGVPPTAPETSRALRACLPRSSATLVAAPATSGRAPEPLPLPPLDRDWIGREALSHPLIDYVFGDRWTARTRSRFRAGQAVATELALRVAGPIAFVEALKELP